MSVLRLQIKRLLPILPLICFVSCQPSQPIIESLATTNLQAANPAPPPAGNKISTGWKQRLDEELAAFGHRNWIVVADAAYPKQSAPGIETIVTGEGQAEVLKHVLAAIESAPHVRAIVMFDKELDQVTEVDAPGVDEYRAVLKELLVDSESTVMPHEEIIAELDEGSELFNVLLLKTNMTIP